MMLARSVWESGGDRARARSLAESAREGYAGAGEAGASRLAETDEWLASHPAG